MYALLKATEFFLSPDNALVVLLGAGAALQWTRWRKVGLHITTASAGALLLLLVLPIGYWMVKPLEERYPRPSLPARIDGILVLGGGLDPSIYATRGAASEDTVEGRLVAAAELARRYPEARLVFSGGTGAPQDEPPETEAARLVFSQIGIPQHRILYEDRSRNTWENFAYSRQLVHPRSDEAWVLVTSASHLPRAMLIARTLHWRLIPWPSDYATEPLIPIYSASGLARNLDLLNVGLHEWIGIAAIDLTNG